MCSLYPRDPAWRRFWLQNHPLPAKRPNGCRWSQLQAHWPERDGWAQPEAWGPLPGGGEWRPEQRPQLFRHICAHTSHWADNVLWGPWVKHCPLPREQPQQGVPPAVSSHPQAVWVYLSGGLRADEKVQRDSLEQLLTTWRWGGTLRRCLLEAVTGLRSKLHGTSACYGLAPNTLALQAERGGIWA